MTSKTVQMGLPRKMSFSTVAHLGILRLQWTRDGETSQEVISDPDFEFRLALHAKRDNFN